MTIFNRDNFYIITGGPGSGKSTLLDALKGKEYQCVDEVARQIIQEQMKMGGDAMHTKSQLKFRDLMLVRSIDAYIKINEATKPVFFDRGIPDLAGYSHLIKCDIPDYLQHAIESHRYNNTVFIAPPWEEIYQGDEERKQSWEEAVATYNNISRGYIECGYRLVELPRGAIEDRVDFILRRI
jgi:predicted ATPase